MKVRQDIIASGFTLNDQESVSLGVNSNNNYFRCYSLFTQGSIHIPKRRFAKLQGLLATCLYRSDVLAEFWPL